MRARRVISALEAMLALPEGADRVELMSLMQDAFVRLGGPTIQLEVQGCEKMQRHYERFRAGGFELPYNRDRQRMTSAIARHVQLLNHLRERAAELARAEFYGRHRRDALASLPPWMQAETPQSRPAPVPAATGETLPAPVHTEPAPPEPQPAPAQAAPVEPTSETAPAAAPAAAEAIFADGDDQPVSGRYMKEAIQRLRRRNVSFERCALLRETARANKFTRAQFKQAAAALLE